MAEDRQAQINKAMKELADFEREDRLLQAGAVGLAPGVPVKEETPTGITSWPGRLKEFVTGDKARAGMEERGISMEGAPKGARAVGSMNPRPEDKAIGTMQSMVDDLKGLEFRVDQETKKFLFRGPENPEWTVIDPPGMDLGDFAELTGELPAITGETLGLLAFKRPGGGAVVSGIWNGIRNGIRMAVGAFGGEYARVRGAQEMGLQDHLSPEEQAQQRIQEPAKAAALAPASALAARTAAEVGKKGVALARGKLIPGTAAERGLALPESAGPSVDAANELLETAGRAERVQPTPGQILNDPEMIQAAEQVATNRGLAGHELAKDQRLGTADALEAAVDETNLGQAAGNAGSYEAGTVLNNALESQAATAERTMGSRVATAEESALKAEAEARARVGSEPADVGFGQAQRAAAEQGQAGFQEWASRAYGELAEEAGGFKFFPNKLNAEARKQQYLFRKDFSGKLTEENTALVDDLVTRLKDLRKTPTGGEYEAMRAGTFEQVQRFISQVKKAEREADYGRMPGVDKKALTNLRKAVMEDRAERLNQFSPELHKKFLEVEKQYAIGKQELNNSIVGKLTETGKQGFKVPASTIFKNIFGKDSTATTQASQEFSQYLQEHGMVENLELVKGAIFKDFMNFAGDGARVVPSKAKKYIKDRAQNLSNYLDPEDLAIMTKARDSAIMLKKLEDRQKAFTGALSKAKGAPFRKAGPGGLFKKAWNDIDQLKTLKTASRKFPREWEMFREAGLQELKRDIMAFDDILEKNVVSFDRMRKVLDNPEYVEKLKTLYGNGYIQDLEKVRNAAMVTSRTGGKVSDSTQPLVPLLRDIYFGPLNHTSFAIKKLGKIGSAISADNLVKVILDPELLRNASKASRFSDSAKSWQRILGAGTGQIALSTDMDDAADVTNPAFHSLRRKLQEDPTLLEGLNLEVE